MDVRDDLVYKLELQQTLSAAHLRELEKVRKELKDLRGRHGALYDQSPIGYITHDHFGHVYDVNDAALQLLGYERERMVHLPLLFHVCRKDQPLVAKHLARCDAGAEERVISDLWLQTKHRERRPAQFVTVPFSFVGARKMLLTAVVDLAERFKRQKNLEESKEFAEAIVDTVSHPLAVLDSELRIISINRAFGEFFDRPADYIRGRVLEMLLNLWWSGNELRTALEKVLVRNQPLERYRIVVDSPELGRRVLLVNARRLYQQDNLPHRLLVALEDVTDRETMHAVLEKANEQLEERVTARTEALQRSNEQMEAFCYSIAHDLRAPLRSMTGFSQILADQFGEEIGEQGRSFTDRIRQSAERMDQLIGDLLHYGRLNTVNLPLEDVDLESVLEEVLRLLEDSIPNVRDLVRKPDDLPPVRGNRVVLRVALMNLISNALKFIPSGTTPEVIVSAEDRDPWIRIWVSDNGIGIAPENHSRIFGVFQRLHQPDSYPGTGIGLALVSKGIERIRGRVGLESELGKGSRFWIELGPVGGGGNSHRSSAR